MICDCRGWLLGIGLLLLGCVPAAEGAQWASPPLPMESPLYPALERLAAAGWIDSALRGSLPFSRLEAARQVAEAQARMQGQATRPVEREILDELRTELREELTLLETGGAAAGSYLRPLRGVELRQTFRDGPDSAQEPPGIVASQPALDYNNDGLPLGEDGRLELTLDGDARFGRWLLLYWRPMVLLPQGEDEGDPQLHLREGLVALRLGAVELSAGRQSLWWGQGRHGSLILTNNARPLDMVRLTNPSPVLLPWFLRYLGPMRFDLFGSRLEEDRVVPEPYFGGLRLSVKPHPRLELGASRTVMLGGKGRPDVDFSDFLTLLAGENLQGDEDNSNSVAAVDAALDLPLAGGLSLYGELGGEDEAGGLFSHEAYLLGAFLPVLGPGGRCALRLEYAHLSKHGPDFSGWYRHSVYQSGYTYRGRILGHHAGGPSKDLFAELETRLGPAWKLTLAVDFEDRGHGRPVRERHLQGRGELSWRIDERWLATLGYAQDEIDNADYVAGNGERGRLTTVALSARF